jgi:biopolymer transport protein ExbD
MAANTNTDAFDINLTPLLDVIMQLIMFFMMCVNFASDQVNQNVLLPSSSSAKEIAPKTDDDTLVINVEVERQVRRDDSGQVVMRPGTKEPEMILVEPRKTRIIFKDYDASKWFTDANEGEGIAFAQRALSRLARDYRSRQAKRENIPVDEVKQLNTIVILRADAETRYGLVVQLIAQCTKEGFAKVRLRAMSEQGD